MAFASREPRRAAVRDSHLLVVNQLDHFLSCESRPREPRRTERPYSCLGFLTTVRTNAHECLCTSIPRHLFAAVETKTKHIFIVGPHRQRHKGTIHLSHSGCGSPYHREAAGRSPCSGLFRVVLTRHVVRVQVLVALVAVRSPKELLVHLGHDGVAVGLADVQGSVLIVNGLGAFHANAHMVADVRGLDGLAAAVDTAPGQAMISTK